MEPAATRLRSSGGWRGGPVHGCGRCGGGRVLSSVCLWVTLWMVREQVRVEFEHLVSDDVFTWKQFDCRVESGFF